MGGAWGSWLRRLRKGQAPEERKAPEAVTAEQPESVLTSADDGAGEAPQGDSTPFDAASAPDTAKSALQLLKGGSLAEARAAADPSAEDAMLDLMDAIEAGESVLKRAGMTEGKAGTLRGVMLAPRTGADSLLVVFGDDLGRFALPMSLALAERPNLLFLQDTKQVLFMLGVPRLGDTYDDCLLAILRLARSLGTQAIFCMGGGNAMYSALRYGLDLGAAGVLGLGTLTSLGPDKEMPFRRSGQHQERLLALAASLGADLAEAYRQSAERPALVLCRPKPEEGEAADGMDQLDGVALLSAPAGARRNPLGWADTSGQLNAMLERLLASKPVSTKRRDKAIASKAAKAS